MRFSCGGGKDRVGHLGPQAISLHGSRRLKHQNCLILMHTLRVTSVIGKRRWDSAQALRINDLKEHARCKDELKQEIYLDSGTVFTPEGPL